MSPATERCGRRLLVGLVGLLVFAGCTSTPTAAPTVGPTPPTASPTASPTAPAGSAPPAWLGTRVLPTDAEGTVPPQQTPPELVDRAFTLPDSIPELPGTGFDSVVIDPAPAEVIARSTWSAACPVRATQLAWVRLTFWGFDNARHTGELLLDGSQAAHLVQAFHALWDQRFPIEQMHITTVAERDAPPTGDGNDTSAFNCRPVRGSTLWSEHAYGLAVDVNPFQNPYHQGDVVLPELARSYLDRGRGRPGVIHAGGPVVRAFLNVGWHWGGAWRSLEDLQHFSLRNR